jgi:hypothetical protein
MLQGFVAQRIAYNVVVVEAIIVLNVKMDILSFKMNVLVSARIFISL